MRVRLRRSFYYIAIYKSSKEKKWPDRGSRRERSCHRLRISFVPAADSGAGPEQQQQRPSSLRRERKGRKKKKEEDRTLKGHLISFGGSVSKWCDPDPVRKERHGDPLKGCRQRED